MLLARRVKHAAALSSWSARGAQPSARCRATGAAAPSLPPRRAYPDLALFVVVRITGIALGIDWLDDRVRRRCEEAVDKMWPRDQLRLVPRSPLYTVQMPAKANRGWSSLSANQTTSFFLGLRVRLQRLLGNRQGRAGRPGVPAARSGSSYA